MGPMGGWESFRQLTYIYGSASDIVIRCNGFLNANNTSESQRAVYTIWRKQNLSECKWFILSRLLMEIHDKVAWSQIRFGTRCSVNSHRSSSWNYSAYRLCLLLKTWRNEHTPGINCCLLKQWGLHMLDPQLSFNTGSSTCHSPLGI